MGELTWRPKEETEYTYYVRDAQGNVMAAYKLNNTKKLDSSQLTIENINVALTGTSGVELFADFAIDVLEIHTVSGLPADYTNHVLSENKISEVLIAFDPVDYLVNVNTGLQNDVLGNYSVTTILQSLADEQGFSTFYTNIMPGVCSTNGTLNPLINFLTANTFLSDWDAYNSAELIAMGNDYDSWLVSNYSATSMPCVDLTGVQALVASQTVAIFVIYLEQATVYHSSITSVLSSISSADFIQQLGTIASLTSTVIQVQFTPTQIFTALREAGLATLWGYISDEMAGYQADILEHYQTNHTTDYVHQCIIVLPSFIDSYITQSVSSSTLSL